MGEQGGKAIQEMIANAGQTGGGTLATVLGVIMLLVGATGLFGFSGWDRGHETRLSDHVQGIA